AANWVTYSPYPVAQLGSTEGWHQIRVGLRGRKSDSRQSWQTARTKLDFTPPALAITNPVSTLLSRPLMQLQGFCPEALSELRYDLTNDTGLVTNQLVQLAGELFDMNMFESTTNFFQGYDIRLAEGTNVLTLHAADLAGNASVTSLVFRVDFSLDTNPPAITVLWPRDGIRVGTDSFTWRGVVSDPSASIVAQVVDANGVTNAFTGRVGRDGAFWIDNLPSTGGTNLLSLVASNVAGTSAGTNISVARSDLSLTIDSVPILGSFWYGSVSDPN